jgi:hypothetical protein
LASAASDFLGSLILPGFGIDSLGDKLQDAVDLFANIVAFGFFLGQPLLSGCDRSGAGANGLANAGQSRLCLLERNFVGLRVDAEQRLAGLDPLIVGDLDLQDPSGDFRRHAHDERLNRRL